MSIGPLVSLASGFIESLLHGSSSGSASRTTNASTTSVPGNPQSVTPFAQILNSLQQVQQSSLSEYQHVTQQIAGYLQTSAQTATSNGDTALAGKLSQLSTDFTNAATSGRIPNL